jgi:hypothetical protein
MSTAYITKAAECLSAAQKLSERGERAALLKVAGSYLLASEVADRQDQDPAYPSQDQQGVVPHC